MTRVSSRIERIVAGLVLGVAFLVMASVIVPHDTQATSGGHSEAPATSHRQPAPHHAFAPNAAHSTDPHEGLLEIDSIESTCYLVRIYAGEREPMYTVIDTMDGRQLGTLLTADEVEMYFPELPINSMEFDAVDQPIGPRIIMLADPADLSDMH